MPWSLNLDSLLDRPRAHLGRIIKRPKPTYYIKTKPELTRRENIKAHLRKLECPIRDSLYGGLSRISTPPANHPTAYEKFVMDKHTKVENIYISGFLSFQITYFLEYQSLIKNNIFYS